MIPPFEAAGLACFTLVGPWYFIAPQTATQETSPDSALVTFLARTRVATERYHDVDRAVADGYRPVGSGTAQVIRYWVHPGHIVHGLLDPVRPSALLYSEADGKPRLVGIAFILQVENGAEAPAGPIPSESWGFQAGDISELGDPEPGDPASGVPAASWPAAEPGLAITLVCLSRFSRDVAPVPACLRSLKGR